MMTKPLTDIQTKSLLSFVEEAIATEGEAREAQQRAQIARGRLKVVTDIVREALGLSPEWKLDTSLMAFIGPESNGDKDGAKERAEPLAE